MFYSFQCMSFTFLVKFIPWYFILLDAIMNGIDSSISFFGLFTAGVRKHS